MLQNMQYKVQRTQELMKGPSSDMHGIIRNISVKNAWFVHFHKGKNSTEFKKPAFTNSVQFKRVTSILFTNKF